MDILVDTRFKYVITAFDIFIPIFFASVILSSMLIYLILFIKIKKRTYFYILIFFFFFVLYNIFHLIALIYGAVRDEINIALEANRISIVSLMLMFIFLSLYNFMTILPDKKRRKYLYRTNLFLFIITLSILSTFILIYFIKPNLFMSVTEYSVSATDYLYQYARSYGHTYVLYRVFKYFIFIFIAINTTISMLKIAVSEKRNKFDMVFLVFMILSFLFIYESVSYNNLVFRRYTFNRMPLSIFFLMIPYTLVLFNSFLRDAVKIIKKQDNTNNDVLNNFEKINNVKKKTGRINELSKSIENKNSIIGEVLKENIEAIDITYNKLNNLDIQNLSSIYTLNSELEDTGRALENTIDSFNNTRLQIDEKCKFLFSLIEDSERLANSDTHMQSMIKNLSISSKNLDIESQACFKKIYQHISGLSSFSNIIGIIDETILSIKNITDKTNLLSINASIHASKAGILGKSFSIVAKEIGTIALENSKLSDSIELILKNILNSTLVIDNANKNIKIEVELLESHVSVIKENISKLILSLEEYISLSIENKKLLKDIDIKGLSIDNIRKQQDSLVTSIQKNVSSLLMLEKNISENINSQKNNIAEILKNTSFIIDMKKDMQSYGIHIEGHVLDMVEKCQNIDESFREYKG